MHRNVYKPAIPAPMMIVEYLRCSGASVVEEAVVGGVGGGDEGAAVVGAVVVGMVVGAMGIDGGDVVIDP